MELDNSIFMRERERKETWSQEKENCDEKLVATSLIFHYHENK